MIEKANGSVAGENVMTIAEPTTEKLEAVWSAASSEERKDALSWASTGKDQDPEEAKEDAMRALWMETDEGHAYSEAQRAAAAAAWQAMLDRQASEREADRVAWTEHGMGRYIIDGEPHFFPPSEMTPGQVEWMTGRFGPPKSA